MPGTAEPDLFYLPYERFLEEVETLARQIEADAWQPDFLVGIGRGGLVPAAYLSHRTGLQMLSVDHSSGEHGFGDDLLDKLAAKIEAGARILIVDDINDSGGTINYLRAAIEAKVGDPAALRVAVLVHNMRSKARAEYHGSEIDRDRDKRWFVFPWEAVAPAPRSRSRRWRCPSGSPERHVADKEREPRKAAKPELRICEADSVDAEAIAALISGAFETSADEIAERLPLLSQAGEPPLLAKLGDAVVGIITWHVMHVLHRPAPVGRITFLEVAETARRHGVGRALVEAAEARMAETGCGLIEVTSNTKLKPAHKFYERLGFERTSYRFARPVRTRKS